MKIKRVFLVVIDSVGCGAMPDANEYGDVGANTIKHISEAMNGIHLPTMQTLGYGNLTDIKGVSPTNHPIGSHAKMAELSLGKDTMTGHWEIMGLHITSPFQTFTETGFPDSLLDELKARTGRNIVGNKAASGTEILVELGEHHMKTGDLIVYTSADSVLQIAAHEEIVPIDELYRICEIARELTLQDAYKVGRVIARPFLGENKDTFKRTSNRHDYALKPFEPTVMNALKDANYDVIAIGKINDIYDGEGVTVAHKSKSNEDGMNQTIAQTKNDFTGLVFTNLVDFDALYGHRRDAIGYGKSLEAFDIQLNELMNQLNPHDLLIVTADHGNDPTHEGSDHTREYVPLLVYSQALKGKAIPDRESFADIGATIAEIFEVKAPKIGKSFLSDLIK